MNERRTVRRRASVRVQAMEVLENVGDERDPSPPDGNESIAAARASVLVNTSLVYIEVPSYNLLGGYVLVNSGLGSTTYHHQLHLAC